MMMMTMRSKSWRLQAMQILFVFFLAIPRPSHGCLFRSHMTCPWIHLWRCLAASIHHKIYKQEPWFDHDFALRVIRGPFTLILWNTFAVGRFDYMAHRVVEALTKGPSANLFRGTLAGDQTAIFHGHPAGPRARVSPSFSGHVGMGWSMIVGTHGLSGESGEWAALKSGITISDMPKQTGLKQYSNMAGKSPICRWHSQLQTSICCGDFPAR